MLSTVLTLYIIPAVYSYLSSKHVHVVEEEGMHEMLEKNGVAAKGAVPVEVG